MNDDASNGSPFHDVGSIFPGDIDLVSVEPSTTVAEALRLMAPNRYSQVPVIGDGRVRGVFSLWSLAHHLMDFPTLATRPALERRHGEEPVCLRSWDCTKRQICNSWLST
jgi:hypothetical protein